MSTESAIQYPRDANGMGATNGQPVGAQLTVEINGNENGQTTTTSAALSADEMALYDRQIRLWGAQAQQRIRSANILLISLRVLGTEIAKNLTLAGIRSLTIVDNAQVTEDDLGAGFFLREEDMGQQRGAAAVPRIQELNPRVQVEASKDNVQDILVKDQAYYQQFACVIACDHDLMTLSNIDTATSMAGVPFYAAGVHGFYGYIFADLVAHEFVVEREKSNKATQLVAETNTRSVVSVTNKKESNGKNIEIVKKQEIYCPLLLANSSPLPPDVLGNKRKLKAVPALLPCLRALFDFERDHSRVPDLSKQQDLATFATLARTKSNELQMPAETLKPEFLKSFLQNIGAEIGPTAAFVGGRLSEDVINVIGKREQPIQNFVLFDGDALDGRIYCLYTAMPAMQPMDLNSMGVMNGIGLDGMSMDANGMMGMNGMAMDPSMMGLDMNMNMNMGMGMTGDMSGMNGFSAMPDMSMMPGMNAGAGHVADNTGNNASMSMPPDSSGHNELGQSIGSDVSATATDPAPGRTDQEPDAPANA